MAKKVTLVDDLDGVTEGASTRRLVVGERTFLIDLTDDNFAKLEKAVERFTRKARETTPSRDTGTDPYAGVDQGAVRQWAQEQGMDIEPRAACRSTSWPPTTARRRHPTPRTATAPIQIPSSEHKHRQPNSSGWR